MNLLFPKVPSGIPGLDKMIGGGYTKNSIITVSGSTGSGRTTFATQFLVNGFRENGEPGIYLSFNEPKYSIFANMSAFDWNLPELERNKQVVFIEYPSSELNSFMEQEGSLLELIDTLGVERVVFDSISPLVMLSSDADERQRAVQKLINVIRKWGVTTLITASDVTPPDPDLPRTSVGIEAMTDGFIHLGWMREGNRRLRTLEVVKMRGSAHAHLIHLTTIDETGYRLVDSEAPEKETKPKPKLGAGGARTGGIFNKEIEQTPSASPKTDISASSSSKPSLSSLSSPAGPKSGPGFSLAKRAFVGGASTAPPASVHAPPAAPPKTGMTSAPIARPPSVARPPPTSVARPSSAQITRPPSSPHPLSAPSTPTKPGFLTQPAPARPGLASPYILPREPGAPVARPKPPAWPPSPPSGNDDDDKDVRPSHLPVRPLFGAPPTAPPLPKPPAKKPPRDENE